MLVSPDLTWSGHLCERVVVMNSGRVVESGSVEQVWGAPRDPYTRELLAAVPRLPPL